MPFRSISTLEFFLAFVAPVILKGFVDLLAHLIAHIGASTGADQSANDASSDATNESTHQRNKRTNGRTGCSTGCGACITGHSSRPGTDCGACFFNSVLQIDMISGVASGTLRFF